LAADAEILDEDRYDSLAASKNLVTESENKYDSKVNMSKEEQKFMKNFKKKFGRFFKKNYAAGDQENEEEVTEVIKSQKEEV
jgi:hypothetical protein